MSGSPELARTRVILLGASNLTRVEVLAGLEVGDRVYLVQPPGVQLPKPPPEEAEDKIDAGNDAVPATGDGGNGKATEAGSSTRLQHGTSK